MKALKTKRVRQYSLLANMPRLRKLMRVPNRRLQVTIIDDDKAAIAGIIKILVYWKKIFPDINILTSDKYPDIRQGEDDIVLLDEKMKNLTGTNLIRWLREDGFKGVIASIASGNTRPPYFRHHFPDKSLITCSYQESKKFILFMNRLVAQAERNRKKSK